MRRENEKSIELILFSCFLGKGNCIGSALSALSISTTLNFRCWGYYNSSSVGWLRYLRESLSWQKLFVQDIMAVHIWFMALVACIFKCVHAVRVLFLAFSLAWHSEYSPMLWKSMQCISDKRCLTNSRANVEKNYIKVAKMRKMMAKSYPPCLVSDHLHWDWNGK